MDFDQLAAATETSDLLNLEPGTDFHGTALPGNIHQGADGEIYAAEDKQARSCAIKIPGVMTRDPFLVRGFHILGVVNDETTFRRPIGAVKNEARNQEGTVTLPAAVPFNLPDVDWSQTENALIRKIDEGPAVLASEGIPCRFTVKQGDPDADILDYAASRKVDLIVVASRGSSGVRRIMGSSGLTRRIVQSAPANELVARR